MLEGMFGGYVSPSKIGNPGKRPAASLSWTQREYNPTHQKYPRRAVLEIEKNMQTVSQVCQPLLEVFLCLVPVIIHNNKGSEIIYT